MAVVGLWETAPIKICIACGAFCGLLEHLDVGDPMSIGGTKGHSNRHPNGVDREGEIRSRAVPSIITTRNQPVFSE